LHAAHEKSGDFAECPFGQIGPSGVAIHPGALLEEEFESDDPENGGAIFMSKPPAGGMDEAKYCARAIARARGPHS
jgi:hypothetical protein